MAITMDERVRKSLDKKLKPYGLAIAGASKLNGDPNWWISIESSGSTFNRPAIAQLLMRELEVDTIVLDGLFYRKSEKWWGAA